MARRSWSIDIAHRCIPMHKAISELSSQIKIIDRGVHVAFENLKIHLGIIEDRVRETQAWASDVIREQQSTIADWAKTLNQLKRIPAPKDLGFIRQQGRNDERTGCLVDYLDVNRIREAGSHLPAICDKFQRDVAQIEQVLEEVIKGADNLVWSTQSPPLPEADEVYNEVETISKKIDSDYAYILHLPNTPRAISNVSKIAFDHTSNLLPSLMMRSRELYEVHKEITQRRNAVLRTALMNMQTISQVQSRLAIVQTKLNTLDVAGDIFDTVYEVFELPTLYGAVLIEAVRRQEWKEQMDKEAADLSDGLSQLRDEERKRRHEWVSSMGALISLSGDDKLEFTFAVQDGGDWPSVSRDDVDLYIRELKLYKGLEASIEKVSQLYRELDTPLTNEKPTQTPKSNDNRADRGELPKESDSVQALRLEKTALEDKLRGSESRIRRLEDLLHRQSERSRPSSAQIESFVFPSQPHPKQSQTASLQRPSLDQISESTVLAQRVVTLEAELSTEKERSAQLQKTLQERSEQDATEISALKLMVENLKSDLANEKSSVAELQAAAAAERQANAERIQDADSIKKDLMGNIQAQQREFEHERKQLEEEIKTLTMKLEEAEDHLDARDTEKLEFEISIGLLKEQLAAVQSAHEKVMASAKIQGDDVEGLIKEKDATLQTLIECLRGWYTMLAPDMEPLNEDNIDESFSAAVEYAVSQRKGILGDTADFRHKAWEVSHRLYTIIEHLNQMIDQLGFVVVRETDGGPTFIQRQKHKETEDHGSVIEPEVKEQPDSTMQPKGKELSENIVVPAISNRELVEWATTPDGQYGDELYRTFLAAIDDFPISSFTSVITKRMRDIVGAGRKWRKNARNYREQYHRAQNDSHNKIAYREFKTGDLALFLPTRNEPLKSWAAFNLNAPHRFLRSPDPRQLATRDWLVARITMLEEHVVGPSNARLKDDASSLAGQASDRHSIISVGGCSTASETQDDSNPFNFPPGQKWYYLDAVEERPGQFISGASTTPASGKSTNAMATTGARGNSHQRKIHPDSKADTQKGDGEGTATKSLPLYAKNGGQQEPSPASQEGMLKEN